MPDPFLPSPPPSIKRKEKGRLRQTRIQLDFKALIKQLQFKDPYIMPFPAILLAIEPRPSQLSL